MGRPTTHLPDHNPEQASDGKGADPANIVWTPGQKGSDGYRS
jgi:hypothetical protein